VSLIDALFIVALMAVAGAAVVAGRRARPALAWATLGLAAFAALQLVAEGAYWQFAPAYGLMLALGLMAVRPFGPWGRAGLAVLALLALAPWALLPVPGLTPPDGPYAVGTEVFRWIDPARPEAATPDPADRRSVVVQAWYPRAGAAPGPHSAYIDGLDRLPRSVSLFPGFMLRAYGRVDTHAVPAAPVSDGRRQWPVVLFSPGYGAPRAFYSSLAAGLASRGYVVLALDHPYEAAVTQLADGRIATPQRTSLPNDPDGLRYMAGQLEVRAADVAFVIERLQRPDALGPRLAGRFDLDRIAAVGHSFGGATAAAALASDPRRIKAAANIDGTLYGPVAGQRLARPFLLLESDHGETGHSERYLSGNRRLLAGLQAGGYRYEIARANHYSFTDAPLFFSGPGRFLLAQLIGGSRGPRETHRATVDILAAFLQGPLTGRPASVEAAAARYPGVAGGPVRAARAAPARLATRPPERAMKNGGTRRLPTGPIASPRPTSIAK
jgi:predicted dienelactone hydrolase